MKFAFNLSVAALALSAGLASPAQANSGGDPGVNGSDIIVTARRIEERLQDVPISITVMNQQQLANHNIGNATDLARYTPSLSTNNEFGANNTTFALRGFTQDIGTAPSVGVYFGDVVAPRGGGVGIPFGDGAGPGDMFDLQNVQVLKGPQGTLQGRNTTGGAVMFVPQKPTRKLEGYVEGSIGNYDMRRLQAVLNLPLSDTIRVRLGLDRQMRQGYLTNTSGVGPSDFGDVNYTALRLGVVIDVTPNIENYTIASYSNSHTNGDAQKLIASLGTGLDSANFLQHLGYNQLLSEVGKDFYTVQNDQPDAGDHSRKWQVINTTTWAASDTLTVKNIISYSQLTQDLYSPLFTTNFHVADAAAYAKTFYDVLNAAAGNAFPSYAVGDSLFGISAFANSLNGRTQALYSLHSAAGRHSADQSTFTEELQLQGSALNGALKWQGGAYFEDSKPLSTVGNQTNTSASCTDIATYQCVDNYGALMSFVSGVFNKYLSFASMGPMFPAMNAGAANFTVTRTSMRDVGLYGQASYKLSNTLTMTAGLRYTWDRAHDDATLITNNFVTTGFDYGGATGVQTMPVLFPSTVPTAVQVLTPRCTMAAATDYYDSSCKGSFTKKSSAPTWLIDLEYKPTGDTMLYAKYARGYRSGGIKHDAPKSMLYFNPEKVDSFEVGVKTAFHGAVSGIFNAAAFYNSFHDQQVLVGMSDPTHQLSPTSAVANAGSSRMWGIEADAMVRLFPGFDVSVGYTYLNTKVLDLNLPNAADVLPYVVTSAIQKGDPLNLSPKNKVTLTGTYTLPLDAAYGKLSVGATFTHTDAMHANFGDRPSAAGGFLVLGASGLVTSHADLGLVQATDLVDVNLNWNRVMGKPVDLAVFATNVTGEHYFTFTPGLLSDAGLETANVGAPRMYGMRLKVHF